MNDTLLFLGARANYCGLSIIMALFYLVIWHTDVGFRVGGRVEE
jgi:hypothetical protein